MNNMCYNVNGDPSEQLKMFTKEGEDDKQSNAYNFKMYQTIKFNRPVDIKNDVISTAGYGLVVQTETGEEKDVNIIFSESVYDNHQDSDFYYEIDKNDPSIIHCIEHWPREDDHDNPIDMTTHMLHHIKRITDWYIETVTWKQISPLIPVSIIDARIEFNTDRHTTVSVPINVHEFEPCNQSVEVVVSFRTKNESKE